MESVNNDGGNVQDELPPFTFVGVSPVSIKSEYLGDPESESYVSDPLLQDPLEAHPDDCNAFKVKDIKKEKDQTKMEIKQEVSEMDLKITENHSIIKEINSVSYSVIFPPGNEMKQSCDELTTNVEGNMFPATEHMGDVHSNQNKTSDGAVSSFCSGDFNLRNSRDLEVKFVSICEPDFKEVKQSLREVDVKCIEDDDESLSLKQGNEESSCLDSLQHVNRGFGVTTRSENL